MTIYVRHDIDQRWHVLEFVSLGRDTITACGIRWPQSDAVLIAERPDSGHDCVACERSLIAVEPDGEVTR